MSSDAAKPFIPPRTAIIPSELVPERSGTIAFFGNQERTGEWLLPRLFRVVSALGSVKIDLTRARVGAGVSHIEVRSVLGSIEIIAPPELRLDCDVSAVMGNFEAKTKSEVPPPAGAPVIIIRGTAFLGNVKVKVVDPNAPTWLDRLTARFSK